MEVQRPRILIIEDNPDIAALLCAMLTREGFPVSTAEDGTTALQLIEQGGIDLLITDIGLPPPLDGIETVRRARQCNPALRSLFISGNGASRLYDPTRDDFVSKPFNERELLGCVWELFSRRPRLA